MRVFSALTSGRGNAYGGRSKGYARERQGEKRETAGGDLKPSAEDEIRAGLTPIGPPRDGLPVSIHYFWGDRRINQGAFQLQITKLRQWLMTTVNQGLNQAQASVDFGRGQTNVVKHITSAAKLLHETRIVGGKASSSGTGWA